MIVHRIVHRPVPPGHCAHCRRPVALRYRLCWLLPAMTWGILHPWCAGRGVR